MKNGSMQSGKNNTQRVSRMENDARSRMMMARETHKGETTSGGFGRTIGSATKDSRHGLHTDHTTTRRSESRRAGSMGRESKDKSNRKNL